LPATRFSTWSFTEAIMKCRSTISLAVIAIALLMSLALPAGQAQDKADPTGAWQVRLNRPGRPASESTLKMEKAGDKLVGVMMDAQGRSTPVKDARLKDGELSFRITLARDGREFSFLYKGKLTADAIKGTASISILGQERSFDFEASRLKGEALLAGLWKISLTLEDGKKLEPTLRLQHADQQLSGGYVGASGKETPLQEVRFAEGELSFKVEDVFDGDKVPIHYAGKLQGDRVIGIAKLGAGKDIVSLKFQAQKMETPTANVAGAWQLKVHFQPGQTFEPVLKLAQKGSSFSGTYHGEQGETAIKDALIFGDEFTFEVLRERNGNRYRLRYQGKVNGDSMKGSVEYDFDGIGGFLEFDGKRLKTP
jgi:hypothetical protein